MRIKKLLTLIIHLPSFGCVFAQPLDTFYVVSQYNVVRTEASPDTISFGNLPMQVYLPNNQQVTLFSKELGEKPSRLKPPSLPKGRQLHCLRIIKEHDNMLTLRIVARDSFGLRNEQHLTADTTFEISEVPFNRNIITVFYSFYRRSPRLIITNQPRHMSHIPHKSERKRKRYLNRYLKGIQYEYNAVTGQLIQLY